MPPLSNRRGWASPGLQYNDRQIPLEYAHRSYEQAVRSPKRELRVVTEEAAAGAAEPEVTLDFVNDTNSLAFFETRIDGVVASAGRNDRCSQACATNTSNTASASAIRPLVLRAASRPRPGIR